MSRKIVETKIDIWFFVPKSGVAFILLSAFLLVLWNRYKNSIDNAMWWLIVGEIMLFLICFFLADRESRVKLRK